MSTVETIEPPSVARETWAVARAAFVVVGGALCAIVAGRAPAGAPPPLAAFQAPYAALEAPAQATFRALAESLPELEALRVEQGAWPTPAALAAAALPPFDGDTYAWALHTLDGGVAAYVGTPRSDARPFLLHLAEQPPAPADRAPVIDETHHRLPDGRFIHVGVWSRPRGAFTADGLDRPVLSGWTHYLAAAPRPEPRS